MAPIAPFLPPAVGFYYLYRKYWMRGRVLRAQRDIIRLPDSPMRVENEDPLELSHRYEKRAVYFELTALLLLALGVGITLILAFFLSLLL